MYADPIDESTARQQQMIDNTLATGEGNPIRSLRYSG